MKPHVDGPDYERMSEDRKILREAKADRDESQKTIHILTEQREDYRKQVVFLEAQIKALRSMAAYQPKPHSHSEGFLDALILAVQDAIIDGEGHLTKHYLEYALRRHDLQLADVRGDEND